MEHSSVSFYRDVDTFVEANAGSGELALPAKIVRQFALNGFNDDELYRIIAPKDRIFSLEKDSSVLPPDIADHVARVAHIVSLAEKVFGNLEKAFIWLRLQNKSLGDKIPLELLVREHSARLVEDTLMRIEYGIYA